MTPFHHRVYSNPTSSSRVGSLSRHIPSFHSLSLQPNERPSAFNHIDYRDTSYSFMNSYEEKVSSSQLPPSYPPSSSSSWSSFSPTPSSSSRMSGRSRGGGVWSCQKCSFINPFFLAACSVCTTSRLESDQMPSNKRAQSSTPLTTPQRNVNTSSHRFIASESTRADAAASAGLSSSSMVAAAASSSSRPSTSSCSYCTCHLAPILHCGCHCHKESTPLKHAKPSSTSSSPPVSVSNLLLSSGYYDAVAPHSFASDNIRLKVCPICETPALTAAPRCGDSNCGWNYRLKAMDEMSSAKILGDMHVPFPPYARPTNLFIPFALPFHGFDYEEEELYDDGDADDLDESLLEPASCPAGAPARLSVFQCDSCRHHIPVGHPYWHCRTCEKRHTSDEARKWSSVDFCYDCFRGTSSLYLHEVQHDWIRRVADEEHSPAPVAEDAHASRTTAPSQTVGTPQSVSRSDSQHRRHPKRRRHFFSTGSSSEADSDSNWPEVEDTPRRHQTAYTQSKLRDRSSRVPSPPLSSRSLRSSRRNNPTILATHSPSATSSALAVIPSSSTHRSTPSTTSSTAAGVDVPAAVQSSTSLHSSNPLMAAYNKQSRWDGVCNKCLDGGEILRQPSHTHTDCRERSHSIGISCLLHYLFLSSIFLHQYVISVFAPTIFRV